MNEPGIMEHCRMELHGYLILNNLFSYVLSSVSSRVPSDCAQSRRRSKLLALV